MAAADWIVICNAAASRNSSGHVTDTRLSFREIWLDKIDFREAGHVKRN